MKTCLLVEDVPEAAEWLARALETTFPGIQLERAANLAEARERLAARPEPELALIDLGLPDGNGVDFIAELNYRSPRTVCVVASIFDDDQHIFPALRAGAQGYLLKDQDLDAIVELLKGIVAGRPPLSPAVARKLLAHFRVAPEVAAPELTERETEVLRLIAKGLTTVEVARLLGISANTVPSYVKEIYRKLNVSSRAEAALTARNMGLV
ncbi:MAG TPA: response regulator transcription factor [Thiobacillaceae bacterium]|nr:response regulator transcription factor [Thiobacillaceae bacterium]HNA82728.1 response regulator transcription factor [Thiobacillaceae bacterium]HNF87816.1 response regulator transcription factor [Thiobacillaceae bacterium]HNH88809.1 response regulator transcription factor [Thiobacillaceae bacterium]HNI08557.1 response regulator transcription factor [Thiobacillaceae bacterium]